MYKTPFIWKNGESLIDSKLAFEYFQQDGIFPEELEKIVNSKLPPNSKLRAVLIARAYDNANKTNFSDKLSDKLEKLVEG